MLLRRHFLIGCLILFAVTSATNAIGDPDDEDEGPSNENRPPPVVPKVDSPQNQPIPSKLNVEQKPVVTTSPARPLVTRQAQRAVGSPPTPLSTSAECKLDVQRHCTNGADKIITNLKVLQCVDELDNVSAPIMVYRAI